MFSSHPFPSQPIPRPLIPQISCSPTTPTSMPPAPRWCPGVTPLTHLCELVGSHMPLVQALGPLLHLNLGRLHIDTALRSRPTIRAEALRLRRRRYCHATITALSFYSRGGRSQGRTHRPTQRPRPLPAALQPSRCLPQGSRVTTRDLKTFITCGSRLHHPTYPTRFF